MNILDPPPVQLLLLQSSSLLGEGGSSQNGKFQMKMGHPKMGNFK